MYVIVMTFLRCSNVMVYVDINASFSALKRVGFDICSTFVNNLR